MDYLKGDLVMVRLPENTKKTALCMVVSTTIPTIYGMGEYFMVYSITDQYKFIATKNFMKKIDKI
jgi:hypothetical protein